MQNDIKDNKQKVLHRNKNPFGIVNEASLGIRLAAFFLDFILINFFTLLVFAYSFDMENIMKEISEYIENPESVATPSIIYSIEKVSCAFYMIYFFICSKIFKGRSLGKKIFNLREVSLINGWDMSYASCATRAFTKTLMIALFGSILIVTFVICIKYYYKKWIHDFVSNTKVIDEYKYNNSLS